MNYDSVQMQREVDDYNMAQNETTIGLYLHAFRSCAAGIEEKATELDVEGVDDVVTICLHLMAVMLRHPTRGGIVS